MSDLQATISEHIGGHVRPLIVILGPTASGKTAASLALARELSGEIISADSRQVYRGMDIGTDKISVRDRGDVPHHMIDVVDPDEAFTLADYKKQAEEAIDDILNRGKIPILVGGTMLYIDAITKNLQLPKSQPNDTLRAELESKPEVELLHRLQGLDPECAGEIDAKNKRRLVRALEYCIQTGEKFSDARKVGPKKYDSLIIGLERPRDELYARIDERIDAQVASGLVAETKRLADTYGFDIPSMSALGYRQIGMHLRGECTLEESAQRLKYDTHAYARRQLTWWRKNDRIQWIR